MTYDIIIVLKKKVVSTEKEIWQYVAINLRNQRLNS